MRFSKEKYINFGIQQVTNNLLEYVDGDGYDFIFNHSNIQHCRIETKSSANMFEFERKKRKGNAAIASAVLKNNRGNGYDWLRWSSNQTFDYLFFIRTAPGQFAMAFIDWKSITQNDLKFNDGNIDISIEVNRLSFICNVVQSFKNDDLLKDYDAKKEYHKSVNQQVSKLLD